MCRPAAFNRKISSDGKRQILLGLGIPFWKKKENLNVIAVPMNLWWWMQVKLYVVVPMDFFFTLQSVHISLYSLLALYTVARILKLTFLLLWSCCLICSIHETEMNIQALVFFFWPKALCPHFTESVVSIFRFWHILIWTHTGQEKQEIGQKLVANIWSRRTGINYDKLTFLLDKWNNINIRKHTSFPKKNILINTTNFF